MPSPEPNSGAAYFRAVISPSLCLLLCLVFSAQAQSSETLSNSPEPAGSSLPSEERLEQASQMIAGGRLMDAVEILNQYKKDHLKDPRPYFLAGMAFTQMQDWSAAAAELKEALGLDPTNLECTVLHANALTRLKQNELAVDSLTAFQQQEALESLSDAWAWLLSDTYYRAGSNDDALKVLDALSVRNPGDPRIDLNRGQIYFVKGDHKTARKFIEQSIETQPESNPIAYFELGRTLEQLGETPGAKAAFQEALVQDPGNPEYLWKLGTACLALGESKEAIQVLEQALPSAGDYPEIYYVLGRAYQAEKDRAKATEALRKFQQISSEERREEYRRLEAGKLVGRGEQALESGNGEEARSLFLQALDRNPNDWTAHGYLAEILLNSGAFNSAYDHIARMTELNPDDPVGMYLSARYWYQQNQFGKARELAEKVRVRRPGNAELRNFLGNIYLRLGLIGEAVSEYEIAVSLAPDREAFQLNLKSARQRLNE